MGKALEVGQEREGSRVVLRLVGSLDTITSPELETVANRLFGGGAVPDVVVDMEECEFVSSAGLRVIIAMQKRSMRGGSLAFRNMTPDVMTTFVLSGFDKILTFE